MTNESRHDRLKRLAIKRTNAILERIRILGNCSNRSMYEYSEEEVNKVFAVIQKELLETRAKFKTKRAKSFTL